MAEFKLSGLNSISEIRSDDLLHVRVKKRTEMLGDEDRRMTYADFLASFRLERFLQLVGGTMTGNLGIVKLTYGGKDLLDPTGNSEIVFGDTAKTFKLNANGLKLTIADASRSATVYHTLNKPSPNELGMRNNVENDARFAIKGTQNTFTASQIFQTDNAGLTLKNTAAAALYYEGRDTENVVRFTIGNLSFGSDVTIANTKQNTNIVLGTDSVGINKQLQVTGQVVPTDFANFDARFYTQNAADQRFVQLAAANTITGNNTFRGTTTLLGDGARLTLKNLTSGRALYIEGQNTDASMKWAVGNYADGSNSVVLTNISNDTYVLLDNMVRVNKSLAITGQVQPSDWTNIDSRFIPAGTLSSLARVNATNNFSVKQNITSDNEALMLKNATKQAALYLRGVDSDGTLRWYVGNGSANNNNLVLSNSVDGSTLTLGSTITANKTLVITGQVQPYDWGNFDARYFTQSAANSRFMLAGATGAYTSTDYNAVPWNAKSGLYDVLVGDSSQMILQLYQAQGSCPSAQLRFNYKNGGIFYRSSRDGFGFEVDWSKIYTEAQKPTPSEIGAYTKAETDAKIADAVTNSTDLNKIYPVGIVTWFATNNNPNTSLPGLTWTYLNNGVGRTIRVGAESGSDVGTTGGSDSKSINVGNLPLHTHSFSATTSSFDYGTKTANTAGSHTHSVSGTAEDAGEHNHQNDRDYPSTRANSKAVSGGSVAQWQRGWTMMGGIHSHVVNGTANSAGEHTHAVDIGAHTHTVSGDTGGTGSGSAFDVTNSYIKLMAWVRTA